MQGRTRQACKLQSLRKMWGIVRHGRNRGRNFQPRHLYATFRLSKSVLFHSHLRSDDIMLRVAKKWFQAWIILRASFLTNVYRFSFSPNLAKTRRSIYIRARLMPVKNNAITPMTMGSDASIPSLNGGRMTKVAKYATKNPGTMLVSPSDTDFNLLSITGISSNFLI